MARTAIAPGVTEWKRHLAVDMRDAAIARLVYAFVGSMRAPAMELRSGMLGDAAIPIAEWPAHC